MSRFSNPSSGGGDLVVPTSIKDNDGVNLFTFTKTGTGTARIETPQDDLSLRSAADITLFAGTDGPGNVYIGWGDAEYTPNSPNRVATIGDIQAASNTYDILYTTHNSDGTNIQIGDDAWIGDIDQSNSIAIRGVQDATQGNIYLGNSNTTYIQGSSTDLNIGASQNVTISADAAPGWINLTAYEGAYVNGIDPNNKIVTFDDLNTAPVRFASGAFHDETSFGPYAANTEHPMSLQTTDFANDVRIAGIDNSEIIVDRDGKFNIAFSAQFHQTTGGSIVYIWLRKNGVAMPWTSSRIMCTANNPEVIAAWNFFVDAVAGDAFELMWSSVSGNTVLQAVTGLTGTKPNVPSLIVTVNQVG